MEVTRITALRSGNGAGRRMKLLADGKIAPRLNPEAAEEEQPAETSNELRRCTNAALGYISYRPRSAAELRQRLAQRGFSPEIRDAVIGKLIELKLLDDSTFAQFWKDNREAFRPQSRRLIRLELKRKGIADDIIDRVVGEVDDEANAHHAALSRTRQLARADYVTFRRRLGGYLQRRGFSSGVISRTLERVWEEQMGPDRRLQPGLQQKER
ncbi:MAG: RecX family transcriptional regulator [Chloroflexi bacterium]|nr:RecX family transcriptional regulator [Chloroflexota bacterium]